MGYCRASRNQETKKNQKKTKKKKTRKTTNHNKKMQESPAHRLTAPSAAHARSVTCGQLRANQQCRAEPA
jgi:hypothetical protein